MSAKLFTLISIRLMSLYLALQGLSVLPTFFTVYTSNELTILSSPVVIFFLLSLILWFTAPLIVPVMIKEYEDENIDLTNSYKLEVVLLIIIGFYIVSVELPRLVGLGFSYVNLEEIDIETLTIIKGNIIESTLKLLLGVLMVVFSNTLGTNLYQKLRRK